MCWMAAIPIAMAVGQQVMGNANSNQAVAAQNDALRRQSIEDVKVMNANDANLKLEQADLANDLRSEKTDANMSMVRNIGTLRTAIGESGLEGNSMKRIQQVTEGDYLRQAQGLNDNYERDYSKIFGQRISNIENTKSRIDARSKAEGRVKGVLEQVVDPLGIGVSRLTGFFNFGGSRALGKKASTYVTKDSDKANK